MLSRRGSPKRRRVTRGVGELSHPPPNPPRNIFGRALGIGGDAAGRDALALRYAPAGNRVPRRRGWGHPCSPLPPSGWKNPLFSSRCLQPSAMPFSFFLIIFEWKAAGFKPEEGGVAQAAATSHLAAASGAGCDGFFWESGGILEHPRAPRCGERRGAVSPPTLRVKGDKIRDFVPSAGLAKGIFLSATKR